VLPAVKVRVILAIALTGIVYPIAARANLGSSYESLWSQISTRSDCKKINDTAEVFEFSCENGVTLWYFTKPGTPAHPGVIKRSFEPNKNGGTDSYVDATSFGSDDSQPAFKVLYDKFVKLDQQMRDYVKKHSAANPKPN
jgi:hypothetical protein